MIRIAQKAIEMSWYDIAVATKNPKAFYGVVKILEKLDLNFRSCEPGDRFCDVAKVVITTQDEASEMHSDRLVIVENEPDEMTTSIDIMMHYLSVPQPREIVIGIDPGLHIGMAVLADGSTVYTRVLASTINAANIVTKLVQFCRLKHPRSNIIVRVGLGSKLYSTLLLRSLVDLLSDTVLQLVNEKHTTHPGGYTTDSSSAVLIASRFGRSPEESDFLIELKAGYIRALRHLFSWLTNNRGELSVEDARKILLGEISISDVLANFTQLEKKRLTV